ASISILFILLSWAVLKANAQTQQCGPSFSYRIGDPIPGAVTCSLRAGNTPLNFSVSTSASWLGVSPRSGSIPANGSGSIVISVNPGGLTAGTYSGTVTVSASGYVPLPINASLTVTGLPVTIPIPSSGCAPSFSYQVNGSIPNSVTCIIQAANL